MKLMQLRGCSTTTTSERSGGTQCRTPIAPCLWCLAQAGGTIRPPIQDVTFSYLTGSR